MALEVSGDLLPPKQLAGRIQAQLEAIRKEFTEVTEIQHFPQFLPGELIISTSLVDENDTIIDKINATKYGPLNHFSRILGSVYHLIFDLPYHPVKLTEGIRLELGILKDSDFHGEGNQMIGFGNDVTLDMSIAPGGPDLYTFKKGYPDCIEGCGFVKIWKFNVSPSMDIKLEK